MPDGAGSVLLFAHGTRDGRGGAIGSIIAAQLRASGAFDGVETAFFHQPPFPADALARLPDGPVAVVPLLASDGRIARHRLPELLAQARPRGPLIVLPSIGLHPGMAGIAERLADAAAIRAAILPRAAGVVVIGHGSSRSPASADATRRVAAALAARRRYAEVAVAFLSEPPLATGWTAVVSAADVIAIPFLLSGGHHEEEDMPALPGAGTVAGGYPEQGRRLWLTEAVGRHPDVAGLVLRQARAALAR